MIVKYVNVVDIGSIYSLLVKGGISSGEYEGGNRRLDPRFNPSLLSQKIMQIVGN
jgi:hypothetical protein